MITTRAAFDVFVVEMEAEHVIATTATF